MENSRGQDSVRWWRGGAGEGTVGQEGLLANASALGGTGGETGGAAGQTASQEVPLPFPGP